MDNEVLPVGYDRAVADDGDSGPKSSLSFSNGN